MITKKLALIIACLAGLACSHNTVLSQATLPAYRSVVPGDTLVVNQPLTIEANLARVYFQYGRVLAETELNRYYPNCSLEVRTLSAQSQTVQPDTFTILNIKTTNYSYSGRIRHYASLLAVVMDNAPSDENWVTEFYLQSTRQPDVLRLNCQHWEDPTNARHVTLEEIRKVLGGFITINSRN